jgi:hypothetical protein
MRDFWGWRYYKFGREILGFGKKFFKKLKFGDFLWIMVYFVNGCMLNFIYGYGYELGRY